MIYLLRLLILSPLSQPSKAAARSRLPGPCAGDTRAQLIQMASPERLN